MNLCILLPYKIFARVGEVSRMVAETREGSFGLLPHRLDCVAALVPGIFLYATAGNDDRYVAVDEGVLVKTGNDVVISVRRAIAGTDLSELQEAVTRDYLHLNAQELEMRSVIARMESTLLGRFEQYRHEQR
jgi:F-type H+-transporting ATPase subunit epsilon